MIDSFNLIATTERGVESEGAVELRHLLESLGDRRPMVRRTSVRGLLTAKTEVEAARVVESAKSVLRKAPWKFAYLKRILPVEQVVDTDLEKIAEAVKPLVERMGEEETYRITVEKRRSELSHREVVHRLAKLIPRKVNLTQPNWVVLVEIVGRRTAVSVLRPPQIFNVHKLYQA